MLSHWQNNILLGTVLGGSSLQKVPKGKEYYLTMRSTNPEWLAYKMEELSPIFSNKVMYIDGKTYRCKSKHLPILTELYRKIYRRKHRNITAANLDPLMDIGICTWYLDAGGKTGRNGKNAYLNVTNLGERGVKASRKYFRTIECHSNPSCHKKRVRLLFTVKGTEELFRIIEPIVPHIMAHRF